MSSSARRTTSVQAAPAASERRANLPRAAAFMVASALMFAAMSAAVKLASQSLPNTMVVFFRSALGLLALFPLLLRRGLSSLRTEQLPEHLLRGVAGLLSMYCFFLAIARLGLAEAVLLNYSLPLFLPLVERAWLKQPVPPRLWRSLALGFAGVVLVLRPGPGVFRAAALLGLLSAALAAVAQVGVRRLTRTEPAMRIVFYFGLVSTGFSALPLAATWRTPDPALWGVLVAMGVVATLGQLLMTRAYAEAPAAEVGPFIYSSVVFAALFDGLLFGRWPGPSTLAGAVLITAAGVLTLRRAIRDAPEALS
jgi:drug/metabolite transporter (DMT)-like permease